MEPVSRSKSHRFRQWGEKNPVFCEMLEELFQNKLVLSAYKEEAAAGAAISSMLCS